MTPNNHCRGTVASPSSASDAGLLASSMSWGPGHASTCIYLPSNVHCQMPCVFDLIRSVYVNLFKAKQLLWPPPKLHPLPETAQHLQSACKLQPSHKLCKPMWKFLKYIFIHTCILAHLKKNISLTWKWIWNKYLYWSVNKRMIRASASGMSGMPTASGMSRSWMPRHASTGTGQSYLSSNVHCQMPCVFDLSIWCFSGLNLFNAKQLLWPPPKLHPLPEIAQHLQSACKLQPSHKSANPCGTIHRQYGYPKYIY